MHPAAQRLGERLGALVGGAVVVFQTHDAFHLAGGLGQCVDEGRQAGLPVDAIAGNSMGAIVGGAFAATADISFLATSGCSCTWPR